VSCGEVRPPTTPDGTAPSQAQRTKQEESIRIAVQQALTAARRAGNVPAGIERLAAETLEQQIPWREVLARFIDDQSRHDYSWMRPNRRHLSSGILLPSLWSPAYGQIVMGCDTSGSVSEQQLREICSEVIGALEAYEERGQAPTLCVAWFDAKVYPQTVESADDLEPHGGGGTRFSVVFDWVADQEEQPRGVVMVTDGHSSDFGTDPGLPVLWVLTAPHRRFRPPFGEVAFTLNA
jgi:predicted metal-dependent peptidase